MPAQDLLKLDLVDKLVIEPTDGAHVNVDQAAQNISVALSEALAELSPLNEEQLVEERMKKFRAMGNFFESTSTGSN